MRCPECGSANLICIESRESISHPGRRRRRHKCRDCGARFSTIEITEEEYQELTTKRENHESLRKMRSRAVAKLRRLEMYDGPGSQAAAVKAALRDILGMEG